MTLEVFDLSGRSVAVLARGRLAGGIHEINWDGLQTTRERAPSGVYFYQLQVGDTIWGRRMLRLR